MQDQKRMLTDTAIVVHPNSQTFKVLKDEMAKVYAELVRIRRTSDMDESLMQRVEMLTDIFHNLGAEMPKSQLDIESSIIAGISREKARVSISYTLSV